MCQGECHAAGCEHQPYMQHGVDRMLAHPRTRDALLLTVSRLDPNVMPERMVGAILDQLRRVSERLDGLDAECGASQEPSGATA